MAHMNIGTAVNQKRPMSYAAKKEVVGPQDALEAYAGDEFDDQQLIAALSLFNSSHPDTLAETLTLLDHYHRRGLIEMHVYLAAKTELNTLLFRSQPGVNSTPADRSTLTALDQFSRGML